MIWRVQIYSYEVEEQLIICDVEAESEEDALDKARLNLVYQPTHRLPRQELLKYKDIIDKAFTRDSDGQPWFWMAQEVDEMEYPIPKDDRNPSETIFLSVPGPTAGDWDADGVSHFTSATSGTVSTSNISIIADIES